MLSVVITGWGAVLGGEGASMSGRQGMKWGSVWEVSMV